MRPSASALAAVGQMLTSGRDQIHAEWAQWIVKRLPSSQPLRRETIDRQLGLLLDLLSQVAGPLRRESTELWLNASEWYGRTAAQRGLAAGEVVEEFQYLRGLLIRHLFEIVTTLPARQSLASVLRLNRLLDSGVAHAVVGYTDVLVESLLDRQGIPVGALGYSSPAALTRLREIRDELRLLNRTAAD